MTERRVGPLSRKTQGADAARAPIQFVTLSAIARTVIFRRS
jgi:hypothetical protein